MSVQYVQISPMQSWLNTNFGLELACKKFNLTPEQVEEMVGRATKGKRKGELRGCLVWHKVTKPGWVKTGRYDFESMTANGFVQRMQVSFGFAIVNLYKTDHDGKALVYVADQDYYPEDPKTGLMNFNSRLRSAEEREKQNVQTK